jgi:hypothetical protein
MCNGAEKTKTARDVYEQLLLSPLDWPLKTTRLQRHSVFDYRQRSLSPNISVAELYHANSKYFSSMTNEVAAASIDLPSFRADFISRRLAMLRRSNYAMLNVGPRWQTLLSNLSHPAVAKLYYACEVRIMANKSIGILEPGSGKVYIAKDLEEHSLDVLNKSIAAMACTSGADFSYPLIAVVVSFARNDFLFGCRGYRRTLVEAGQLCHEVVRTAADNAIHLDCHLEFIDRDVDEIIGCDGLEESVIALLCSRDGGQESNSRNATTLTEIP